MSRKRHTPEQIIGKLREAEVGPASGQTVPEVCRTLGITVKSTCLLSRLRQNSATAVKRVAGPGNQLQTVFLNSR